MPSAPPIDLPLRASRWQRVAAALLAIAVIASVLAAPWRLSWRLCLAGLVLGLAIAAWQGARRRERWRRLQWRADGQWRLLAGDRELAVALDAHGAIGPVLLLTLRESGRRRHRLLLWPDSADADGLRRLRIRLARTTPGVDDAAGGRA